MKASKHKAGSCRFCRCTESDPCKLPTGDACGWLDSSRTVCTAPGCITAYFAQARRVSREAGAEFRKRTPAQIHALIKEEKNAKQRAYRAKKKQQRGAA